MNLDAITKNFIVSYLFTGMVFDRSYTRPRHAPGGTGRCTRPANPQKCWGSDRRWPQGCSVGRHRLGNLPACIHQYRMRCRRRSSPRRDLPQCARSYIMDILSCCHRAQDTQRIEALRISRQCCWFPPGQTVDLRGSSGCKSRHKLPRQDLNGIGPHTARSGPGLGARRARCPSWTEPDISYPVPRRRISIARRRPACLAVSLSSFPGFPLGGRRGVARAARGTTPQSQPRTRAEVF